MWWSEQFENYMPEAVRITGRPNQRLGSFPETHEKKPVGEKPDWKPIKDFEHYLISPDGVVFNTKTNRKSNGWLNKSKTVIVNLYREDHRICRSVPRCVYIAYVGEIPKGYIVRHKDGDCRNNDYNNLYLGRGGSSINKGVAT